MLGVLGKESLIRAGTRTVSDDLLLRDIAFHDEHEARPLVPLQSWRAVIQALSVSRSRDTLADGESFRMLDCDICTSSYD